MQDSIMISMHAGYFTRLSESLIATLAHNNVTSDTEKSFGCEADAPETFFDRKPTLVFTAAMKLTV
jgi:hypothetical protein